MSSDYTNDIRSIVDDLKSEIKDGTITDASEAHDWLHETIDSHQRCIYTAQAKATVEESKYGEKAYIDDFGTDGLVKNGGLNWEGMAYAAMMRDVMDEAGDLDELIKDVLAENEDEDEEESEEADDVDPD